MAPADGFCRAHRPLGLLRLPGLGRRQVGRAGRRRLPPHAGAAVLWRPGWAPEERLAGSHSQPRRHIISEHQEHAQVASKPAFPGSNFLPSFI
jgi:hypothetical protein